MNTRNNKVPTKFGPNTRFALPVLTTTPTLRSAMENELERLKERLLAAELARTINLDANVLLRRAANDAVALVWRTPCPLLLLPALFEEKARTARLSASR